MPEVERMIDKVRADLVKLGAHREPKGYACPLLMDEETRTGSVFKAP
jgi:hypothetical protein